MKKFTKTLTAIALTAGVGTFAYKKVGEVFYNIALSAEGIKKMSHSNDIRPEEVEMLEESDFSAKGKQWYKNCGAERTEITSALGDKIIADIVINEEPTDKWVIICHGYLSCPSDMRNFGAEFEKNGFNILFPIMRGHDESPCEYTGMGWIERLDVMQWIDYILTQNQNAKIVLFGVSMGAACVMMTTGERLPENVVCAIADCGYTSVWDIFSIQLKEKYKLPPFPFLDAVNSVYKKKTGFDLKQASTIEQVKKSKIPTLFIHGEKDTFVPFAMLDKIYEAAACEKEKYVVEGAGHATSALIAGEAYVDRVYEFVKKYVN